MNKPLTAIQAWDKRKKEKRAAERQQKKDNEAWALAAFARAEVPTAEVPAPLTQPAPEPAIADPLPTFPKGLTFDPVKQKYRVRVYFTGKSKQLYWGGSREEAEGILANWNNSGKTYTAL